MFSFQVSPIYPHEAPKVKCKTKVDLLILCSLFVLFSVDFYYGIFIDPYGKGSFIDRMSYLQLYHPNIDLEGNVCLNILREDWKPVLNINTIIYGLYHLFTVLLDAFLYWSILFCCLLISECCFSFNSVCRNQIMRIPLIMMQLQCWEITQRCLKLTWEGLWPVGMWGKPFFNGVCRFGSTECHVQHSLMIECPRIGL